MNSIHDSAGKATADVSLDRLFELAEVLGRLMTHGIDAHGLTAARARLLWVLLHHGPMTQRALADALDVTPRNVTGLLDALEADGHVERVPHPTDRRATMVRLTDHGTAVVTHLREGRDVMAAALFADIPETHLAGFTATIATVTARLRGTTPAPGCDGVPAPQLPR